MNLKRILQFSVVALLLVPGAAFADTFSLTGGTWTDSGDALTLTSGTTTLATGDLTSFFFFGASGDAGSLSTSAFSCTDCVKSTEALIGLFDPSIFVSGTIDDGGVTGTFSADLVESNIFSDGGKIESGSIDLDIPSLPTPEPSVWLLLVAGLALIGTATLSRKLGWVSQSTERSSDI